MSSPRISLLICTRNRAHALQPALAAVERAIAASRAAVELVLVDNGSTDATQELISAWSTGKAFPVKLVVEPAAGLARARNAGFRAASYELVAMTDDDCEVSEGHFTHISDLFDADPTPRIVGGRVELGDPLDLPITIKTSPARESYVTGQQPGGFVIGANLVIPRAVFDQVGPFDERFGAGARFIAAEDTDYILRANRLGVRIDYEPGPMVRHFHGRREMSEALNLYRGYFFGDGALYAKHFFKSRTPIKLMAIMFKRAAGELLRPPKHPLLGRGFVFRSIHVMRGFTSYLGN